MIIKRYVVDNMNEAMIKIRYELGSEAVIVSQRKIKQKGLIGIFKKKKLEVTAAVDDKPKKNVAEQPKNNEKDVYKEIDELKSMIQSIVEKKDNVSVKKESKNKFKQKLIENDILEEIVDDLLNVVREKYKDKRLNASIYEKEIYKALEEIIKVDEKVEGRIQVFVGPTGVGKTTTIAKLASHYTLYQNKKVGLVTIDTYRIGAVEQLKTYAEILGVPFGVILTSKDIPEVMEKMKDCDIILVDTMGRNSKNTMQISEIRKFIEELRADKTYLVVSMTTKQKDLASIIDNYKIVNYNSMILTKVDETDVCGSILTCIKKGNVPVSYLTFGQNVPEDIETAKKDKLARLILGADN
ncbi:flagellar biosynthesis regulator FlhF [Fervidicella metallireducens AeB]|uniref:Flagellar biosynthesis protein FlhF n=1 Tax=Fervidicella metallireducens AeB TaxID=1403537 RepID=A0A017RWM2_9CLOT|nr:flagellar biosynthesis protein FlhF [Fervidicella metallireducens]EYE88809.1 flagellar biosynthesis regulator FlhF [Fervidicella metallireducens AeB]